MRKTGMDFVAVDIGAGSGRVVLYRFDDGAFSQREIERFPNGTAHRAGHLRWDIEALRREVVRALASLSEEGVEISGIGIDTWGVDFVLLDETYRPVEDPVAYRDARTEGMIGSFARRMPLDELYARTGTQLQMFNTVFQLEALARNSPDLLSRSAHIAFVPDYLAYCLGARPYCETTIASTSAMMDSASRTWDMAIFETLGIGSGLFGPLLEPGNQTGVLKLDPPAGTRGLTEPPLFAAPAHDTASAVLGVPAIEKDWVFISSGTWCLMGIETDRPVRGEDARRMNFTNELGFAGTVRLLKNCMGLWILRSVKDELGDGWDFEKLKLAAADCASFGSVVDVDDAVFFNPPSMMDAMRDYCRNSGQRVPESPGEFYRIGVEGLALAFRAIFAQIRTLAPREYSAVHLVGGGSQDPLLCQLSADLMGIPVIAGPEECTSMGNALSQAVASGRFENAAEARAWISGHVRTLTYRPRSVAGLDALDARLAEARHRTRSQSPK